MIKKILDMNIPRISVFPIYGYILSILPKEKTEPWIYNIFIQLRYLDNEHILFFEQYRSLIDGCPYINRNTIERTQIDRNYKCIIDYIEDMISQDKYIFLHIDRFYISFFEEHNQKHVWHELLVFGYDKKEKLFYCADNGDDGKYTHFICEYKEFLAAYNGISGLRFQMDVHTLELVKWWNEEDENIRMNQIFFLLEGYYFSKANIVFSEPFTSITYGFNSHYKVLDDVSNGQDYIDFRAVCLLVEHKLLMKERFQYIYNLQNAQVLQDGIDFYEKLCKRYRILLNIILKYNLYHSSSRERNNILEHFKESIELEEKFIKEKFDKIKVFFERYRKTNY